VKPVRRPSAAAEREWPLTALVVLEAIALFVLAPLGRRIGIPFAVEFAAGAAMVGLVLVIVSRSRAAMVAVIAGAGIEAAATILRFVHPSSRTEAVDFAAALLFLIALTVVLAMTVFGPGRVTIHRILGAIAIYLNVAVAFALAYRLIDALVPGAFATHPTASAHEDIAELVYFSFTTLTTSGYGDIVPVDPLARSMANLESVFGQLFPATLLARLITLEIESTRGGVPTAPERDPDTAVD
jgi:Ion channel